MASSTVGSTPVRAPPLTQSDAITSLLSLGLPAGDTEPIPIRSTRSASAATQPSASLAGSLTTSTADNSTGVAGGKHHRRLGSTGKTRRRLSDAREASTRPIFATSPPTSGLLSLASLSLSTSPPSTNGHGHGHSRSLSFSSLNKPLLAPRPIGPSGISISAISRSSPIPIIVDGKSTHASTVDPNEDGENDASVIGGSTPIPISGSGKAKKRGVDYKCESCAKIYRHPNCLNKHRWEHTRQWREASKFVLSKHQQVQLLEAATILSFMGQVSTSLPEDRSEWPSFLSGGSLPKVEAINEQTTPTTAAHPISSSVPARMSTPSQSQHGPRLHDYAVPSNTAGSVNGGARTALITQLRPGLVGVPTVPSVPAFPVMPSLSAPGGWSLPSSSIRSQSASSSSRSRSGSRSSDSLDIEVDEMPPHPHARRSSQSSAIRAEPYVVRPIGPPLSHHAHAHAHSHSHSLGAPGYGSYGTGTGYAYPSSYGSARRLGTGMKREEDEMSVGFSVKEEDEDEDVDVDVDEEDEDTTFRKVPVPRQRERERRWDGMEMEVDMDMD